MGSPVVDEWEKLDYIVALGQKGQLVQYSSRPKVAPGGKNKQIQIFSRRDVVNNADILGPLINHMGMRPTIADLQKLVDEFFWRTRPRGKAPMHGSEIKMQAWSLRQLVTQFGRAARRPHVPREAAMRQLYVAADVPLPGDDVKEEETESEGEACFEEEEMEEEALEEDQCIDPKDMDCSHDIKDLPAQGGGRKVLVEVPSSSQDPVVKKLMKAPPTIPVVSAKPTDAASCAKQSIPCKTPSPKGVQPALVTPPKVCQKSEIQYAHALVARDGSGFICEACSSIAPDLGTLSAIPCTPSKVFKSKGVENINQRLREEHILLDKLRKLRLLELEESRLTQLKQQRDLMASRSAPAPAQGMDNLETQPMEYTDSQIATSVASVIELEKERSKEVHVEPKRFASMMPSGWLPTLKLTPNLHKELAKEGEGGESNQGGESKPEGLPSEPPQKDLTVTADEGEATGKAGHDDTHEKQEETNNQQEDCKEKVEVKNVEDRVKKGKVKQNGKEADEKGEVQDAKETEEDGQKETQVSPTQEIGKDKEEKEDEEDKEDKDDQEDKEDMEDKEGKDNKEGKEDVAKALDEVVPGKEHTKPRRKSGKSAADKAKKKKRPDATKTNAKDAKDSEKRAATPKEQTEVEEGQGEEKSHRPAKKIQRPGFLDEVLPIAPKDQAKGKKKSKKSKQEEEIEFQEDEEAEQVEEDEEVDVEEAAAKPRGRPKGKAKAKAKTAAKDKKAGKTAKEKATKGKKESKGKTKDVETTEPKRKSKSGNGGAKKAKVTDEDPTRASKRKGREGLSEAEIAKKNKQSRKSSAYHVAFRKAKIEGMSAEDCKKEAKKAYASTE